MKRDFLTLTDLSATEHEALFQRAQALLESRRARRLEKSLEGRTLGLLFEKPSTRTRVSFEAAVLQLGGGSVSLPIADSQIKRGETLEDTARVLSRYVDLLVFRTFGDERLHTFAAAATVPVINALSDGSHPVQLLADLLTIRQRLGKIAGQRVAYLGDGSSNMARSWIEAARLFDFELTIASARDYQPPPEDIAAAGKRLRLAPNREAAARGADVLATDVWTNMGQEDEAARRRSALGPFAVEAPLLALAAKHCIVLHCLPAHRGEEISAEVLDGPQSAVFDEAENRLHVQKALLEKLLLAES